MPKVTLYMHKQTDENSEWAVNQCEEAGIPRNVAEGWLLQNPFYEVSFDFEYDPTTDRFTLLSVRDVDGRDYQTTEAQKG